ncbi:MAG: hypothetical protein AMXMBFR44_6930 [Candidatus Campbellbacteria bacterium]
MLDSPKKLKNTAKTVQTNNKQTRKTSTKTHTLALLSRANNNGH